MSEPLLRRAPIVVRELRIVSYGKRLGGRRVRFDSFLCGFFLPVSRAPFPSGWTRWATSIILNMISSAAVPARGTA